MCGMGEGVMYPVQPRKFSLAFQSKLSTRPQVGEETRIVGGW